MRTFSLVDNDGNLYDLTVKDKSFLYGVTGLGYSKESQFQRIKERFKFLKMESEQQKIKGTVRFWQPNAEAEYFAFAQLCQNSPLKLRYAPKSGSITQSTYKKGYVDGSTLVLPYKYMKMQNYYRDGYVTAIEKSDGVGNCLEVVIEFTCETPWYKNVADYNYGGSSQTGKEYSYTYPYGYTGSVSNEVTIDSDSREQSPCKIVIMGYATDPIWRHYLNDVLVATGKLNGSILTDHKLVIDTTTIPYSIKEFDSQGNEVADLYQSSDFTTERFIRLGYGKNRITVSAADTTDIGIGVEAQIEYATV